MILRFPSGLYQDAGQLPEGTDTGNVTFVISNEEPKRSSIVVVQLPVSEEIKPAPAPLYSELDRREAFGELVYTLVESNRTESGSNKKLFSIGDFLEFSDDDVELPDLLGVPRQVDIQHNTNLIDYADAGLTVEEISEITISATAKKRELESEVASLQSEVANLQSAALENQKRINEIRKLISAVSQISGSNNSILIKLQTRESDLELERDSITNSINTTNDLLKDTYNSLLDISGLVH